MGCTASFQSWMDGSMLAMCDIRFLAPPAIKDLCSWFVAGLGPSNAFRTLRYFSIIISRHEHHTTDIVIYRGKALMSVPSLS